MGLVPGAKEHAQGLHRGVLHEDNQPHQGGAPVGGGANARVDEMLCQLQEQHES